MQPLVEFNTYKKVDKPIRVPSSCQQYIPVQSVNREGIFKLSDDQYSAMWQFSDINYRGSNESEKEDILLSLAHIYDTLTDSFKIIIVNRKRSQEDLQKNYLYKADGAQKDLKVAYDKLIQEKIMEGRRGLQQDKYFLAITSRKNQDAASSHFVEIESQLSSDFETLGSRIERLSAADRIELLHAFFHPDETSYHYDFDMEKALRRDWKNDVCPSGIQQSANELQIDGKYHRCLYLREWPKSGIDDKFLSELTGLPYPMVATLDVAPIPQEATYSQLDKLYMKLQTKIFKEKKSAADRGTIATDNYYYLSDLEDIQKTSDSMKENDETMYFVGLTIDLMADTLEELNQMTEACQSLAAGYSFVLSTAWLRQKDALMTVLPVGVRYMDSMRTLLSQRVAAMMPFSTRDYMHVRGVYYGQNPDSKQPIFLDRLMLDNGNAFFFGKAGFGKSFLGKFVMQQVIYRLLGRARFVFIDPQCEKQGLVEENGGAYIKFGISTGCCMNPLEIPADVISHPEKRNDFIGQKISFLIALVQLNSDFLISGIYKSLINRCGILLYDNWFKLLGSATITMQPQLEDFYNVLLEQPEEEARELAVSLETLITGPLSIFNGQSTVSLDNDIIGFGFDGLSKDLLGNALLIIMEYISDQLQQNHVAGYMSWVDVEEFHYVTKYQVAADYFHEWYKMVRKMSGFLTATTQNLIDAAKNETMKSMIANSEMLVLMAQNKSDVDMLVDITGLDRQFIKKLQIAHPGTGIIKFGNSLVEFDNRLPKESVFYKKWNTDGNKNKAL